jgi:hypothetical protein
LGFVTSIAMPGIPLPARASDGDKPFGVPSQALDYCDPIASTLECTIFREPVNHGAQTGAAGLDSRRPSPVSRGRFAPGVIADDARIPGTIRVLPLRRLADIDSGGDCFKFPHSQCGFLVRRRVDFHSPPHRASSWK